eukprot:CAMPEP_0206190286 /NCGR_PEP_ID=MMETSP0166-20121206/4664_1 /ASSEMBLY_ACC=CAM_ASM_000260 /TAXON_ID=95228 /ORGANISM="Vannella robusta, Strain DIVA3 518/3/11/1/6" /LENGTH=392 /DNA_ID=CAMNT_0053606345 /DNA_START=1520 /DNA_END=2698 /DNA_ORIENTATION=-
MLGRNTFKRFATTHAVQGAKVTRQSLPYEPFAAVTQPEASQQQGIVIPRWWKKDNVLDPKTYMIDGKGKLSRDDLHPSSSLTQEMIEKYENVGLVYVVNTGIENDLEFQRDIARIIMTEETVYEGGANPRNKVEANVYDVGAPLEAWLHYHHEMTYKEHSCKNLGFLCKHAVQDRPVGWSFVSDSVQAHDAMMETALGRKLKEKGLCFIRLMTDANAPREATNQNKVYNHWQQSWLTDDPDEAEVAARAQGLHVEWIDTPTDGRLMRTRYYKSAFEYVPFIDRNILFTSIADDGEWFDAWPGIKEIPHEQRPLEMMFGDDTPFTLEEKQAWTDIYDEFGIPLRWQPGEVAVFCNYRFAHGRPSINLKPGERRELGVMLGAPFKRIETVESKW